MNIVSLRRTLDQSLMKMIFFKRVQEMWSGQESVMEGLTDGGGTEEGHSFNTLSALQRRIKIIDMANSNSPAVRDEI